MRPCFAPAKFNLSYWTVYEIPDWSAGDPSALSDACRDSLFRLSLSRRKIVVVCEYRGLRPSA